MVQEAIKSLGGRDVVAEACGITPNAVYKWTDIPPKHWTTLAALSKGEFSLDDFAKINAAAARAA